MDVKETYCLLCPLGCTVGLRVNGSAVTGPEFCPSSGQFGGRVCPRGLYLTELLNHPQRVSVPRVRKGEKLRDASWEDAVADLSSRLNEIIRTSGPQSVAIVTDGMRSTEELQAVGRFARVIGTDSVACVSEPQDWPLVASGESAGVASLEEAECVIVLGDVFVTHPVLASRIIDSKYAARGNSLFVVSPRRSNTAWFASEHIQNRPGSESLVLASLLKAVRAVGKIGTACDTWVDGVDEVGLLQAAGISRSTVAKMASAFAGAAKAAIIVAPSARGMTDMALVATLAGAVASAAGEGKNCMLLPSGGNVRGAWKTATEESWMSSSALINSLQAGKYKVLLNVGTDIASVYPSAGLTAALAGLDMVGTISLLRDATERMAAVVLAGASWLESGGSAALFDGSVLTWDAAVSPSWGTRTVSDAISLLEGALDAPKDSKVKAAKPSRPSPVGADSLAKRLEAVRASVSAPVSLGMTAISLSAAGQSGSGSVTGRMDWAAEMFPGGFIEVSMADATAGGISDGDSVIVASESAEVEAVAKVTDRLQAGVIGVPEYDVNLRALFSWVPTADGSFSTGPGAARVTGKQKS
ncbi:MAG: molybdopterin-dependent oxidoreductase [Dehalococcoidia bacterium]|nr:molybdopterin-dependent oxidoreductase [Dehalococcoidia bacterium]